MNVHEVFMQQRGESRQNQPGELTRLDQGYLQSKVEGVHSASISQVPPVCQAASGVQEFNREQNTHRLCPQEFHADGKQADGAMVFTIRIRRTSEAMAPCNLQLGYACGSQGGGGVGGKEGTVSGGLLDPLFSLLMPTVLNGVQIMPPPPQPPTLPCLRGR